MNATKTFLVMLGVSLALVGFSRAAQFQFRDVAAKFGITQATRGMMAHAAAWGDVDRDGKPDLWIGTFADRKAEIYQAGGAPGPVPNILLMRRNDRFLAAANREIAWRGRATGCVMVDFDNDGWSDLYVSNNGRLGKENLLYHNRRGTFKLITHQAGAPLELPEVSRGVSVLDYNGDGLLDILVLATVNRGESMLFENLGAMRFRRSTALPADLVGLGVAVGDITGNSWPDVFVGGPNRLFVNRGGKFREATELNMDWGFRAEDDAPSCGAAFGDVDRDGDLDLLIGSHTKRPWVEPVPLRLFLNDGSSETSVRFSEVTEQVGLAPLPMKTPHVEIRDFDNDGWPDLYSAVVVFKDDQTYPLIYENQGAEPGGLPKFRETAFVHRPDFPEQDDYRRGMRSREFYDRLVKNRKLMYFAPGPSTDFDADGRLDLMLPNWFSTQSSLLLRNETKSGNYLDIVVVGQGKMNRDGIGAIVRAYPVGSATLTDGAGLIASEQIATGYGYASGQFPLAHLGLGDRARCDIVIGLPHGRGKIVRRRVDANQRLVIELE